MACLRRQAADGRVGAFSCDEEGCILRLVAVESGTDLVEVPSQADCVLQLQLRAGDAADSEYFPDPDHEDAGQDRPTRPIETVDILNISFDDRPNAFGYGIERAGESLDERYKFRGPSLGKPELDRFAREHVIIRDADDNLRLERRLDLPAESGGDEPQWQPRTVYKHIKIDVDPDIDVERINIVDAEGNVVKQLWDPEGKSEWVEYPESIKREDLEPLLGIEFSDWQWRLVDLIVNQGYGLRVDGDSPNFVISPRRK